MWCYSHYRRSDHHVLAALKFNKISPRPGFGRGLVLLWKSYVKFILPSRGS